MGTQPLRGRGNETAGDWAKSAAENEMDTVARDYLYETSSSRMIRMATEAWSARAGGQQTTSTADVATSRPKVRSSVASSRPSLAVTTKLLPGKAATGDYLRNKVRKLPSDRCWWCGRHHVFVNCEASKPQVQELWKEMGKRCGWKHPRVPRMALILDDESAMKVVLSLLWKSKVGQMVTIPPRGEELGEEDEESAEEEQGWEVIEVEGEEGGPGWCSSSEARSGGWCFSPFFLAPLSYAFNLV